MCDRTWAPLMEGLAGDCCNVKHAALPVPAVVVLYGKVLRNWCCECIQEMAASKPDDVPLGCLAYCRGRLMSKLRKQAEEISKKSKATRKKEVKKTAKNVRKVLKK